MSKAARASGPSGGLVLLVLFLVLGPLLWLNGRSALAQRASGAVAQDFATAWVDHRLEELRYHPSSGPDLRDDVPDRVADETQRITAGLTDAEEDRPASVVLVGEPQEVNAGESRQRLRVTWDLGQGRRWEYDTVLPLRIADENWMPVWGPSVVHPAVVPGLVLTASRIRPAREEIIGGGERALTTNTFVVDVGIRPGDTNNRRAETATRVARLLGRDVDGVVDQVTDADDEDLVEVMKALPERECVRCSELRRTPGVVVTRRLTQSAALAGSAQQLLGAVQPADEPLRRLDAGRIALGDLVGVGGLQRRYDAWLAGTPGVEVRAVAQAGSRVQPPAEPIWTTPMACPSWMSGTP